MSPEHRPESEGKGAFFECGCCGSQFPADSVGKKNEQGLPLCIPCSLKATSSTAAASTRDETEGQKARVEAAMEKLERGKGSRRLVTALLILAIPVIALELFLLVRNRPAELTPAAVAEIELSEDMIMMTVLGQYYDDHERYPADLESLVPDYWSPVLAEDLQKFQYTPIGEHNFRLERIGSALPPPLVVEAQAQDLLPAAMTAETDLDTYYDRASDKD